MLNTGVSRSSYLLCAALAALVWLALMYCTRNASYAWDDFTVIAPLFGNQLAASLGRTVRPLEYFVALLSKDADFPVWLVVNFVAYVVTAAATLKLLTRLKAGGGDAPFWKLALCATTPVAALAYFQIDLVSQALSNFFAVVLVLRTLTMLEQTDPKQIKLTAWSVLGVSLLCIASKETSYGMIGLAALLGLLRHRKTAALPLILVFGVLIAVVVRSLEINDLSAGAHYGLKPFWAWPLNLAFLLITAVAPAPTSTTLTQSFLAAWPLTVQVIAGVLVALAIAWLVIGGVRRLARSSSMPSWRDLVLRPWESPLLVVGLFALASGAPALFFHVSEMYASQALPCILAVLLGAIAFERAISKNTAALLVACAACWVMASAVNLAFYTIITGYEPGKDASLGSLERAAFGGIEHAVASRRSAYSVYGWTEVERPINQGECKIDVRFPRVCLPHRIIAGFPKARDAMTVSHQSE